MTDVRQSLACPSCSFRVPLETDRVGHSAICPGCKVVFTVARPLEQDHALADETGRSFVLSPDGSWAHVCDREQSSPNVRVAATASTRQALSSEAAEPETEPPGLAVSWKLGDVKSEDRAGAEPCPASGEDREAECPPGPTTFAGLEWYASANVVRATIEARGYALEAGDEGPGGSRLLFEGRMGDQRARVLTSFDVRDRLEVVSLALDTDEAVRRDIYTALHGSLDSKYGTERLEDHGGDLWSTTWLVQALTPEEWSVSLVERLEQGRHALRVLYNSPAVHARSLSV